MAAEEDPMEISDQNLLAACKNVFSEQIPFVKTVLKSRKGLICQEILDRGLLACRRKGNIILIPDILKAGANLEVTDENGNTPLLLCSLNSHEMCTRFLLDAGSNVNAVNFEGNTPLINSVLRCDFIAVTKLLISTKDVIIDHTNNKGYTAFIYAVKTGNLNAIKILIDAGARSDIREDEANRKGLLRLIYLFKSSQLASKSLLLQAILDRDLESAQFILQMDESIVNASNESVTNIIIEFLKSIQSNNLVNETDVEIFKFLLTRVALNSNSSSDKETIIDIAFSIGHQAMIECLADFDLIIPNKTLYSQVFKPDNLRFILTKRHVINKLDSSNQPMYNGSPLHRAIQEDQIDSAKALLQHGAYMDLDKALDDIVKRDQEKALHFLISEFATDVRDKLKSAKLLRDAVINSSLHILLVLLDHGADVNAKRYEDVCLTQAVDVKVLELLLARGADPNIEISNSHTYPLHVFLSLEFKKMISEKFGSAETNRKIKELVECLLRNGARVDLKDGSGKTALHIAACKAHTVGLFKILINAGADVNSANDWGLTPLHRTVLNRDAVKLNCLVRNKANIDAKDNRGKTALQYEAGYPKSSGILKTLLDLGAAVNCTDNANETPLSEAVTYEACENIKYLTQAGADVNCVCASTGKTVIFQATNENVLHMLLDSGANVQTVDGESPLNTLLKDKNIGVRSVKRLIDAGCNVNHKDIDGHTALIHAAKYVDRQLLELLVQEGADVNASGKAFPFFTAVTEALSELSKKPEYVISCVNYLIDQNADIDNIPVGIIHVFMTFGCSATIPKFITRGFTPSYLHLEYRNFCWFSRKTQLSPLRMALLMDQSDLARYLIRIRYIMKQDIGVLYGDRDTQEELKSKSRRKSLALLEKVCEKPLSLETLCMVNISDTLGPAHSAKDRRSKVQKLELPQPLKDSLLFKNAPQKEIKDEGFRNPNLFEPLLKSINLLMPKWY